MSHGPRPSQLELAQQVQAGWQQAVAHAIRGDVEGAAAALEAAERALAILLEDFGRSAGAFGSEVLRQLLGESGAAIAQLETALRAVEGRLEEVRRQQMALRSTRLALDRVQPRPRRIDERI